MPLGGPFQFIVGGLIPSGLREAHHLVTVSMVSIKMCRIGSESHLLGSLITMWIYLPEAHSRIFWKSSLISEAHRHPSKRTPFTPFWYHRYWQRKAPSKPRKRLVFSVTIAFLSSSTVSSGEIWTRNLVNPAKQLNFVGRGLLGG